MNLTEQQLLAMRDSMLIAAGFLGAYGAMARAGGDKGRGDRARDQGRMMIWHVTEISLALGLPTMSIESGEFL